MLQKDTDIAMIIQSRDGKNHIFRISRFGLTMNTFYLSRVLIKNSFPRTCYICSVKITSRSYHYENGKMQGAKIICTNCNKKIYLLLQLKGTSR